MEIRIDSLAGTRRNIFAGGENASQNKGKMIFAENQGNNIDIYESQNLSDNDSEQSVVNNNSDSLNTLIAAGLGFLAGVGVTLLAKRGVHFNFNKKILKEVPLSYAEKCNFDDEIRRFIRYENFEKIRFFNTLSDAEKSATYEYLESPLNLTQFLATINGNKPANLIITLNRDTILAIKNGKYNPDIEFVNASYMLPTGTPAYNVYMVNKPALIKVIERNKDVFTSRLRLSKKATTEEIYTKALDYMGDINRKFTDIEGMCLGFPKYSSMIFNLEQQIERGYELRTQPEILKKKLLEILYEYGSPYKNLSKKEFKKLEKAIGNISAEKFADVTRSGSYNDGLYLFAQYLEEPDLNIVANSTADFMKNFKMVNFM